MINRMFLTLALILIPFTARAQPAMPAGMLMMTDCDYTEILKSFVYDEERQIPFVGGVGIMQRHDGEFAEGVWKVYVDPDQDTYSIVREFPADGVMCLVGMGEDLAPFEEHIGSIH